MAVHVQPSKAEVLFHKIEEKEEGQSNDFDLCGYQKFTLSHNLGSTAPQQALKERMLKGHGYLDLAVRNPRRKGAQRLNRRSSFVG